MPAPPVNSGSVADPANVASVPSGCSMAVVLPLLLTLAVAAATGPTPEALLARARAQVEALEFEDALQTSTQLTAMQGVQDPVFVQGQVIRGSVLAVLGRIVEAETPFRLILRVHPDFDLPDSTPPKILTVFRKVQVDERRLARDVAEARRRQLMAGLKVEPQLPATHEGGLALSVQIALTDPDRGVRKVSFSYRMGLVGEYDTINLTREQGTLWTGEIGGDRTSNQGGVVMCWFVTTQGAEDLPLTTVASAEHPRVLEISGGDVSDHTSITSKWWFWTAAAAVVAAGTVSAVLVARTQANLPDSDLGAVSFR